MEAKENNKKTKRNSSNYPPSVVNNAKRRRFVSESAVNSELGGNKSEESMNIKDFICPICLDILIEPVVLPCKHELCLECFNPYLENTSLTCPICRIRIAIWARTHGKNNTLVDCERWEEIKRKFPNLITKRLAGVTTTDNVDNQIGPSRILALDGEIRKEYEEELKKVEIEAAENAQADLDLIKLLQAEDENLIKIEEADSKAAWNLQKEEMLKSGKFLRIPSEHKYKLSHLLRSPKKLRTRTLKPYNRNKTT